jgi:hypothetical protein
MGGGDRIDLAGSHEFTEPGVAQAAGSLFDGLAILSGFRTGIDLMGMPGEAKRVRQIGGEFLIGIGAGAAQSVVEMSGVEDYSKFAGSFGQGAGQSYGVRTSGEADG